MTLKSTNQNIGGGSHLISTCTFAISTNNFCKGAPFPPNFSRLATRCRLQRQRLPTPRRTLDPRPSFFPTEDQHPFITKNGQAFVSPTSRSFCWTTWSANSSFCGANTRYGTKNRRQKTLDQRSRATKSRRKKTLSSTDPNSKTHGRQSNATVSGPARLEIGQLQEMETRNSCK